MTVQELIDLLNDVEDKSLHVHVYADHGQHAMKSNEAFEALIDISDSERMPELIADEDTDDFPDAVKVFLIASF